MDAVVQSPEGAAQHAADGGAGRAEEDRAHDDADHGPAGGTLRGPPVLGLVDLDPASLRAVGDRGVDDLDAGIALVDALDLLEEPPGSHRIVDQEGRHHLF